MGSILRASHVVEEPLVASSSMGGLRGLVICTILLISLSYILYSTNLLVATRDGCHLHESEHVSLANSASNTSAAIVKESISNATLTSQRQQVGRVKREEETNVTHIMFGIAAASDLWTKRKEYIKQWWQPKSTRGHIWVDKRVRTYRDDNLPEIRVSGDTSRFPYNHPHGSRSALRISRIVSETVRLRPKNVRWLVMGDDDTVFVVDNVVRVLRKFDHTQNYYIGSPSENHIQNLFFSYQMAYGGGGFAISYPLAVELEKMQDQCIRRYPFLYGSDDRIHACMAELGVPLTKHVGFHQYDVTGDVVGMLAAHPVTPLVSLHHLDMVDPIFPDSNRPESIRRLLQSVKEDSASIVQQSICYDKRRQWSISVSWGYVVQIYRGLLSPRELEMPMRTFYNWLREDDQFAFTFNTRPIPQDPCHRPFTYYMTSVRYHRPWNSTVSRYSRHERKFQRCKWKGSSPELVQSIVVFKKPDPNRWDKAPRKDCCNIMPSGKGSTMHISVNNCEDGQYSEL